MWQRSGRAHGINGRGDPILAKVVLTWTPPSGTITGYKVYFGISSGTETLDRTLTGSPITCTETYSFGGSTGSFYYKVSAVNAVGEGPLSGEAIATTAVPPKPTSTATQIVVKAQASTHPLSMSTRRR